MVKGSSERLSKANQTVTIGLERLQCRLQDSKYAKNCQNLAIWPQKYLSIRPNQFHGSVLGTLRTLLVEKESLKQNFLFFWTIVLLFVRSGPIFPQFPPLDCVKTSCSALFCITEIHHSSYLRLMCPFSQYNSNRYKFFPAIQSLYSTHVLRCVFLTSMPWEFFHFSNCEDKQ